MDNWLVVLNHLYSITLLFQGSIGQLDLQILRIRVTIALNQLSKYRKYPKIKGRIDKPWSDTKNKSLCFVVLRLVVLAK